MAQATCLKCGKQAIVTEERRGSSGDKDKSGVSYNIDYPCGCSKPVSINHMKRDKSPVNRARDIQNY